MFSSGIGWSHRKTSMRNANRICALHGQLCGSLVIAGLRIRGRFLLMPGALLDRLSPPAVQLDIGTYKESINILTEVDAGVQAFNMTASRHNDRHSVVVEFGGKEDFNIFRCHSLHIKERDQFLV